MNTSKEPLIASTLLRWNLRRQMAKKEIYTGRDLKKRLAEAGYPISEAQISRLKRALPKHLDINLLAALCLVLESEPADLLQWIGVKPSRQIDRPITNDVDEPLQMVEKTQKNPARKSILKGRVYPSTGPEIGPMPRGKI